MSKSYIYKKSNLYLIIICSFLLSSVFISCAKKNEVPGTPNITGPVEGWIGEEDTFFVTGTDLDEDSLSYLIDWGDGNFTLWSDYFASGDTISSFHTFAKESTYSIYAITKDINSDTSNWSEAHQIIIFKELKVKWQYEAPPLFWPANSPAVDEDGTIYVILCSSLYSLSPNGVLNWSQLFSDCYLSSPSIGDDGTIYLGCSDVMSGIDSKFCALNPDGTIKWSYPTDPTGGAIGIDGTIYFGSSDSCLYALNPDGTLKWSYKNSGYVCCTPIIGQSGNIYFGTSDGYYWAINSNGNFVWKLQLSSDLSGSHWRPGAISDDETIYTAVHNGELYAITSTGSIKWQLSFGTYHNSPIVGADGTIYIGSKFGFYAIFQNGNILWQYPKECWSASAITVDNSILVPLEEEIFEITASGSATGKTRNIYIEPGYAPAISDEGTIYVVGIGQSLVALQGSASLASSAWPMYQHDARHTGRAGP